MLSLQENDLKEKFNESIELITLKYKYLQDINKLYLICLLLFFPPIYFSILNFILENDILGFIISIPLVYPIYLITKQILKTKKIIKEIDLKIQNLNF